MADNLRKFSPDKHIDPARNFLTLPRLRVAAVMGFILGLVQMGVWSFAATAPGMKQFVLQSLRFLNMCHRFPRCWSPVLEFEAPYGASSFWVSCGGISKKLAGFRVFWHSRTLRFRRKIQGWGFGETKAFVSAMKYCQLPASHRHSSRMQQGMRLYTKISQHLPRGSEHIAIAEICAKRPFHLAFVDLTPYWPHVWAPHDTWTFCCICVFQHLCCQSGFEGDPASDIRRLPFRLLTTDQVQGSFY